MRKLSTRKVVVGAIGVTLAAAGVAFIPSALADPATAPPSSEQNEAIASDDLPNPLGDKQKELTETAVSGVVSGKFTPTTINGSSVVKVGHTKQKDQYVELAREGTDRIFVVLAEFGNTRHPSYPDVDTHAPTPGPITWDGPLVNQIPQPNRAVDNSTVWQPSFDADYFRDLYFGGDESLRHYYETQSSGRYSVEGTVTDWVKVTYNQARYGRSNGFPCGSSVCSNTWQLVRDAANQWVADQIADGRTLADIQAELATFDVNDRYDHDGDGDFNEPDGYLDHFQIVHAGGDQADGDPIYGEDAIWSHRWYTFTNLIGVDGPPGNLLGGNQIGTTGFWIGDYTIQPENGGRSVFYHEYAHDLGLPDDYNFIFGGDNNNEHWTLMAQSRLGAATDGGIGERGGDLGAWNKLVLGWLDYEIAFSNQQKNIKLGPQEYNTANPQAAIVILPQKAVVTDLGAPYAGVYQWYTGTGDDLNNTLTRSVTLGAGPNSLTFQGRWDIEDCGSTACDYAFVEVNTGSGWTAIPGNITNAAEGHAIEGTVAGWTAASFDLSAYSNSTIQLRFRYFTDGAVAGNGGPEPDGLLFDDIAITGGFTDGAETLDPGWTVDGFERVQQASTAMYPHYYIAGHRSYVSFDKYLETGPYYFGYANTLPDFVDHYNYQQGLLISYWDLSFQDNDTFAHPGQGRNLYIDAHPQIMIRTGTTPWRSRVQVYDAPFSKTATDGMTLHHNSVAYTVPGLPAADLFDDTQTYWFASLPNHGVILPAYGVTIRVLNQQFPEIHIVVN